MRLFLILVIWSASQYCVLCERGVKNSKRRQKREKSTIQKRNRRRLNYNYAAVNKYKVADPSQGGAGRFRDPNVVVSNREVVPTKFPTQSPSFSPSWAPSWSPTWSPVTNQPVRSPVVFEIPVDGIGNSGIENPPKHPNPVPVDEMDDPEYEDFLHKGPNQIPEVDHLDGMVGRAFGPIFDDGPLKKIKGDSKSLRNAIVDSYSLGNRRLYGLAHGSKDDLYISELYFGGIYKLNITSGAIGHLVPSFDYFQRPAGGMAYSRGFLFVAGLGQNFGVQPSIHVYHSETGEHVIACRPPFSAGQILDITIVENTAYATDSVLNQLITMNVDDAIHGVCNMTSIFLPYNTFLSDDVGPLELGTGIAPFEGGLIISNHAVAGLFYHHFETGITSQFLFQWDLPSRPSGLRIHNEKYLFVAHEDDQITMWKLKRKGDYEVKVDENGFFQTDLLNGPRSLVFVGMTLFTVNAKINLIAMPAANEQHTDIFDEEFDLVAIMI